MVGEVLLQDVAGEHFITLLSCLATYGQAEDNRVSPEPYGSREVQEVSSRLLVASKRAHHRRDGRLDGPLDGEAFGLACTTMHAVLNNRRAAAKSQARGPVAGGRAAHAHLQRVLVDSQAAASVSSLCYPAIIAHAAPC